MGLVHDQVAVGDMPEVRIQITAPPDRSVRLIRQEFMRSWSGYGVDLVGPDGARVPGGPYSSMSQRQTQGDLFTLPAGSSREMTFPVYAAPRRPGPHRVRVYFYPLEDHRVTFKGELKLQVVERRGTAVSPET